MRGSLAVLVLAACIADVVSQQSERWNHDHAADLVTLGDHTSTRGYHISTAEAVSWFKANVWCQQHRMQLLNINGKEEDRIINRALMGWSFPFWTGGNDLNREGEWTWHPSGRTFNSSSGFSSWAREEPDNRNGKQHCLTVTMTYGEHKQHCLTVTMAYGEHSEWRDSECLGYNHFICQQVGV